MYHDREQWVRLAYCCLLLLMVVWLIQPEQLIQFSQWQDSNGLPGWIGLVQVALFTISVGLIFPKSQRLQPLHQDGRITSDFMQLIIGVGVSALAWAISLL